MTETGPATISATHRPHVVALDSLRGLAALCVALYHLRQIYPGILPIFHNGYLMVDLFFVLSGFAIYFAYHGRINTRNEAQRFIWLRFWRLYPLHLFFLIVFLLLEFLKLAVSDHIAVNNPPFRTNDFSALLSNLFLLQGWHTTPFVTFNGPSWSISAEFYVYAIFAAIALLLPNRAAFLAAASIICLTAAGCLMLFWPGNLDLTLDFGWLRCLAGFFLGVLTCAVYFVLSRRPLAPKWARRIGLSALGGLLLFVLFLVAKPAGGYSDMLVLPMSALLILLIALPHEDGPIRILCTGPLRWLGAISYSIYMVHDAVVTVGKIMLHHLWHLPEIGGTLLRGRPVLAFFLFAIYLTVVLGLAQLTYSRIEAPFRAWSRRGRCGLAGSVSTAMGMEAGAQPCWHELAIDTTRSRDGD